MVALPMASFNQTTQVKTISSSHYSHLSDYRSNQRVNFISTHLSSLAVWVSGMGPVDIGWEYTTRGLGFASCCRVCWSPWPVNRIQSFGFLWTHLIFINFGVESFEGKQLLCTSRETLGNGMISNEQKSDSKATSCSSTSTWCPPVASTTQVTISVKCHREALACGPRMACRVHIQTSRRDQMHSY